MIEKLSGPIRSTLISGDQDSSSATDSPGGQRHRIVFLHGLFGRGKNFTKVAQALAPQADSLLIDLPNHGASGWTEHFVFEEMADLVAAHILETFPGEGPVDLIGHSMGGKVAMVLALRHPELIRRLVIIDISPVGRGADRGNFRHLFDSLLKIDLATLPDRRHAEQMLEESIESASVRSFLLQNLKRTDDGFAWQPNLELLSRELPTIMDFPDMSGRQFRGPVLWMRGEKSSYVTDEDLPAMRELFPRVLRVTVRDAGHWVHSEQPDAVIASLTRFLL